MYLAEITNGVELGVDFLAITDTLEEAKAFVEKHNIDVGVVTFVEKGIAYPEGMDQQGRIQFDGSVWVGAYQEKEEDDAETNS